MLEILKNFLPQPIRSDGGKVPWYKYLDILGLFETDPWGNSLFLKRLIIFFAGWPTYWRLAVANKLTIEGGEHLKQLPNSNVLFISNHQTYFADAITFYHIFCAAKWGMYQKIYPIYLLFPRAKSFYVAARETMKSGWLPMLFSMAGGILVERSWRSKGQDVQREVDDSAAEKIKKGLDFGWVITFPQGTTSPYAPIRKGTAHLIRSNNPIIVPVVIDGFRRAFNKTGLGYKKRNTRLKVRFKPPIYFSEEQSLEEIIEVVKNIIEQNIPENIAEWRDENS